MKAADLRKKSVKVLLACGIFGSLLYPITDIIAGNLYKGYSFNEQAVSELFANQLWHAMLAILFLYRHGSEIKKVI